MKRILKATKEIVDSPISARVLQPQFGRQFIYIPSHLFGEFQNPEAWKYPNGIQPGFVYLDHRSGDLTEYDDCFMRYWRYDLDEQDYVPELRTLANSELTPKFCLFWYEFFTDKEVSEAINLLVKEGS